MAGAASRHDSLLSPTLSSRGGEGDQVVGWWQCQDSRNSLAVSMQLYRGTAPASGTPTRRPRRVAQAGAESLNAVSFRLSPKVAGEGASHHARGGRAPLPLHRYGLARGVRQKLSNAPGKKQAFRQAFWACNKRTNRRISKPTVADNQQLTYKRTGDFRAGINDWPSQNHS